MNEIQIKKTNEEKKESKFIKILKFIFVKNAAYKLTALLFGIVTFIVISVF